MAIDTTLYTCPIPTGSYAVGDKIAMAAVRGPSIVRDGYGAAYLKRVISLCNLSGTAGAFKINLKNSNWVDGISNPVVDTNTSETALAVNSASVQEGQNLPLVSNSGWFVELECILSVTTTADSDAYCLIDVDYPSVAAIQDPRQVVGYPVTIDGTATVTSTAAGQSNNPVWNSYNVDIFKAGSKYLLTETGFSVASSSIGFMSISGAAGQAGLERIIPVRPQPTHRGIKYPVDYATPLVKGPMNLNFMISTAAGGSSSMYYYLDFVKKNI